MAVQYGKPVRLALWTLLVTASVVLLRSGVFPALRNSRGDFANYYTASRLVLERIPLEPAYRSFTWFQKQMDRYGIEHQVGGFIPHPPTTALLLLPLADLPPIAAKRIWILLNVSLVIGNIYLLSRISGLDWLITAVLFMSSGYGLLNNFLFGQPYLLLLLSILLGLSLISKNRPVSAGVSLGSLVAVKYISVAFLFYYAWKRRWKLVAAAAATAAVFVLLSVLLTDLQTFSTFVTEVLPRHLQGEIQDPFSVYFQSWNSLFRRLFLREAALNPLPAFQSPFLFFLAKNIIFWILGSLAILVLVRSRFQDEKHTALFRLGWIPLAVLLLSPGSATYHFLLLTISVVFFVKIQLDLGRPRAAAVLGALFAFVNLPHFMKLRFLAEGWWTPLAYTRLWSLCLFAALTLFLFRSSIDMRLRRPALSCALVLSLICVATTKGYHDYGNEPGDAARSLKNDNPDFRRHLGLIVDEPDVGTNELVFSYCELLADDYAVYAVDDGRWTPEHRQNFFSPDLAPDDSSLLVETWNRHRPEIWLSHGRGDAPTYLASGEGPAWSPDGIQYAYLDKGKIVISTLEDGPCRVCSSDGPCYDAVFSPSGGLVAFCVVEKHGTSLRTVNITSGEEKVLFRTSGRVQSPEWSESERHLLFSWAPHHNRDIYAIDVESGITNRLTFDRATDDQPVWDAVNHRIVFISDRGRGLGCGALYFLPIPENLR